MSSVGFNVFIITDVVFNWKKNKEIEGRVGGEVFQ